MSAAKHTPGPWRLGGEQHIANHVFGGHAGGIAICFAAQGQDDARLIAAAPELLEACLALIKTDDLQAAIDKARAAIAKVTGSAS